MIEYRNYITRQMLINEREKLFVFGDNFDQRGLGGQAKEMRGEPNAVGIPTKRHPTMNQDAFLTDADGKEWFKISMPIFIKLEEHIIAGGTVVWPSAGIGTGLARLDTRAPKIYKTILIFKDRLERLSRQR